MTPHPEELTLARDVIANPAIFADCPSTYGWAWERHKAARGQSVQHENIGIPAHRIVPNPDYDADAARRRRIAAHAKRSGLPTGPAPLIATGPSGDAA